MVICLGKLLHIQEKCNKTCVRSLRRFKEGMKLFNKGRTMRECIAPMEEWKNYFLPGNYLIEQLISLYRSSPSYSLFSDL